MPQYGAKMLQWAPFAATNPEPADSLPNYGTPMNLGALQSVAETLNFSEGEARGDDVRKIYIKEFVDGSLAVGVLELANATASAITGATIDSTQNAKDIHFSANDNAPYGCLGFYISCMKDDGTKYYKGIFYPKVKASMKFAASKAGRKAVICSLEKAALALSGKSGTIVKQ